MIQIFFQELYCCHFPHYKHFPHYEHFPHYDHWRQLVFAFTRFLRSCTINFLYYSTSSRKKLFNVHFQTWTQLTKQTMKVRFKSNSHRQRRNKLLCNWTQHLNWVWKDKLATEKSSPRDSQDINQVQIMEPPLCQKRVSSFQNMIQILQKIIHTPNNNNNNNNNGFKNRILASF